MPHHSLKIAGGLAAALAMAATPALAQTAEEGKAQAAPYLSDAETLAGAPNQVLGTVVDTNSLTTGSTDVGVPYGEGFSAGDWELDENIGDPVLAMTDRALVAKGKPTLAQQGVDTGLINQGLSLDAGATSVGTMNSSPQSTAAMGMVSDIIGGIVP